MATALEAPAPVAAKINLTSLGGHVRSKFELARRARIEVERRMLEDLRQKRGKYSSSKLAAIREVMGKNAEPPFLDVTGGKCEATYAWLIDAILPPGQDPFSLEATPLPELPGFVETEIQQRVQAELLNRVEMQIQQGLIINQATLRAAYAEMMEQAKDIVAEEILEQARESATKMFTKIKDQFAEGEYETALRQALHDLVDVGTAIIRGPVLRHVPVRRPTIDPASLRFTMEYTFDVLPVYERLSPLRFYPSPDATRASLPYYVYVNSTSRADLASLLEDDSYDAMAVAGALAAHGDGYREVTSVEVEKAHLEERTTTLDSELIDRLEFGGSIPGYLLEQFGIQGLDPIKSYDALVWMVGSYVLKAVINPDPVGLNYIFSAGFSEMPDSFWGIGIPRKMRHTANIINIAARALVMNIGIASGPMIEANMDRMWPGENFSVRPWGVLKSTNAQMQEGKAVNFYQPNMVTQRLIDVMEFGLRMADIETGIPRILYAGETSTPTASANADLMSQASKGGQAVVRNIDMGLIIPSVVAQHNYNMQYDESGQEYVGDVRVIARGSNTMVAKAQKVMRLKEILRDANNPTDLQIITVPIRAKLWRETVDALGVDPRLLGQEDEIDARAEELERMWAMSGGGATAGQLPGAVETSPAGQPVAGRDAQLYASTAGSRP